MVDSIGGRPTIDRVAAVARVIAPRAAATAGKAPATAPTATLAAQLASAPPVDTARVAQIKKAVAEGNFPLSPATIADQLIALKYEWMSDDAA